VSSVENTGPPVRPGDQDTDGMDEARRAALLRLAKYTAPAMLALLLSENAAHATTFA